MEAHPGVFKVHLGVVQAHPEPQRLNWKHGGFIRAIDADLEPQSLPGTKESYYGAVCRSSSMDAHPVDEEAHHIVQ